MNDTPLSRTYGAFKDISHVINELHDLSADLHRVGNDYLSDVVWEQKEHLTRCLKTLRDARGEEVAAQLNQAQDTNNLLMSTLLGVGASNK